MLAVSGASAGRDVGHFVGSQVKGALGAVEIVQPDQGQAKAMRRLGQLELVGGGFTPGLRHIAGCGSVLRRQGNAFGQLATG